jgi:hypothetical protein
MSDCVGMVGYGVKVCLTAVGGRIVLNMPFTSASRLFHHLLLELAAQIGMMA